MKIKVMGNIWRIGRYTLLGYGLLCALFFANQQRLFFHPEVLPNDHQYAFSGKMRFQTVQIPFDETMLIEVVQFLPEDSLRPSQGVVLYFHGNKKNVEHYSQYVSLFTSRGYEVWMPEYPGFGKSTGDLTNQTIQEMALQVYALVLKRFEADDVTIYGKSLGTGPASFLASKRDCRQLILETPYYSLGSVVQSYAFFLPVTMLLRYDLSTAPYFSSITVPITVLAAGNDETIPPENTLRLLPFMKVTDQYHLEKNTGHNGLADTKGYKKIMDSVLGR